ncbi:MAG: hypothetical protein ACFNLV_06185 [Prevotella nigrescens]
MIKQTLFEKIYIIAIFIHKTRTCTQPRLAGVADLPQLTKKIEETQWKRSILQQKGDGRSVNIIHKRSCWATGSLSAHCINDCMALQNNGFCVAKAALLHCKTAVFAMAKRSHRFSTELSLQSLCRHSNH